MRGGRSTGQICSLRSAQHRGARDGLTLAECDKLRERRVGESPDYSALDACPEQLRRTAMTVVLAVRAEHAVTLRVVDEAGHRRDGSLQRENSLVHRDLVWRSRQSIAAVGA